MEKILIAEDDNAIAELEKDYLEINGYDCDIADDGTEALKRALTVDYDLLILDIMLPGKSGYDICREVRAQKDIPIIMVTAKQESIDKIRGLGLGADDYVSKPFDPGELVARVKVHIERYNRLTGKKKIDADVIEYDGLRLEKNSWKVFVDGKEIEMANKEFELLTFLMSNPNKVFSKEYLFERIWGYDFLSDSATVAVHINRIRDKIEPDRNVNKYISTIRGAGYRFNMKEN
ncbi:MAG: response regulator transcription factor [Clostridiales bacterium]|nr:response regulator transcription factor [Clostridiales bacterium]MCD7827195.1 response regulator transcription factor [Clostridiales bacterium]